MSFKIVRKYFDVVPLFRYKEIELKERLTLIFYMAGFGLSVIAIITTFLLGKPPQARPEIIIGWEKQVLLSAITQIQGIGLSITSAPQ